MSEIEELRQQLASECTRCRNTFSGVPMLVWKGGVLQCRLRTCNRKRHKAGMAELTRLEKEAGKKKGDNE